MKKLYFIIPCIILFACTNHSQDVISNVIDVEGSINNAKIVECSSHFNRIDYVPLETTSQSLIGTIRKVEILDSTIFVMDNSESIVTFSKDGRYISRLNRKGNGPQEYSNISDFYVDIDDRSVVILDSSGDIVKYDLNNNFLSRSKPYSSSTQFLNYDRFFRISDSSAIISAIQFNMSDLTSTPILHRKLLSYTLSDTTVVEIDGFSDKEAIEVQSKGGKTASVNISIKSFYISQFGNVLSYIKLGSDTISKIVDGVISDDYYVINYGKYKKVNTENRSDSDNTYISLNGQFIEDKSSIFFNFNLRSLAPEPFERVSTKRDGTKSVNKITTAYAIYNKKSGKLQFLNQPIREYLGLKDNIKNGVPFWPRYYSDGKYISYINALDLILFSEKNGVNKELANIIDKIDEESNPILILAI